MFYAPHLRLDVLIDAPHPLQPKNYRGVRYHKERRQWQAYVLDEDQVHWLGFYNDEEEAARAHDAEALRRFGPSADVNFGTESPTEMLQVRRGVICQGGWWSEDDHFTWGSFVEQGQISVSKMLESERHKSGL